MVRGSVSVHAGAVAVVVGVVGRRELDLDRARRPGVVDRGALDVGHGVTCRRLEQAAGAGGGEVPRRVAPEPLLDRERAQLRPEQLGRLAADDVVAGHERDRRAPGPAQRGVDADFADERPVEAQVAPAGRADGVRQHASLRSRAGVLADEERDLAALLEHRRVLGPACLDHELAACVERVRDQRVERPVAARAVAVHHDDLGRPAGERAAHGRVDLLRVEPPALLVARLARAHLLPARDARHALHVADDQNPHGRPAYVPRVTPRR